MNDTMQSGVVSLTVDIAQQRLRVQRDGQTLREFAVSTAANGVGQQNGSGCTPLGRHRIRLKIGAGRPLNSVFVARRATGEIYSPQLAQAEPQRDWILTRILWLTGCEHGFNRGGECDTLRRFIYIHGCPDSEPMGEPRSHGCIRMRNGDVVELFDLVENGTPVLIEAG